MDRTTSKLAQVYTYFKNRFQKYVILNTIEIQALLILLK